MKTIADTSFKTWIYAPVTALVLVATADPARAAPFIDIQPVSICLDNGASCGSQGYDAAALKTFFLNEVGLNLNILTSRTFNSTTFQTMDNTAEATSFVVTNPSPDPNGPTDYHSAPITVWFASAANPFDAQIAVIDANRSWVNSDLNTLLLTRALGKVLGHNLGLERVDDDDLIPGIPHNLVNSLIYLTDNLNENIFLTAEQRTLILQSRFVYDAPAITETPLPAALPLFGTGLGVMGLLGWRRKRRAAIAV